MRSKSLKVCVHACALVTVLLLASPFPLNAQFRVYRGPQRDNNKPPDPAEFQTPANNEFKANPTFFESKNNDEKCKAVDLWLSSIRFEVSQSRQYGNRSYYSRDNNVLNMDQVEGKEVVKYSTAWFQDIFSRDLVTLSDKDSKEIGKFLGKCSDQRWVEAGLATIFNATPSKLKDWATFFGSNQDVVRKEKAELAKRLYREKYSAEVQRTGYVVAEPLKETDAYKLNAAFLNDGDTNWCSPADGQATVVLIHNVEENVPIQNNEAYWHTFETELLPEIRSRCAEARKIYVINYVRGLFIDYDRNAVRRSSNGASDVLNIAVYAGEQTGTGRHDWINGETMSKLSGSTYGRSQSTISFRPSDTELGKSNLASIEGVRRFLTRRQARLDEEARLRSEKAAAEEAAARAEAARIVEARRARLATGGFSTQGLKHEEILANIFVGDFKALPFENDDMNFSVLFGAYLKSFSETCPNALPKNKVQLTRQVCDEWWVTKNGWGAEISRSCTHYTTEATGTWADPELYAAQSAVDRASARKMLSSKSGGGVGGILGALTDMVSGKTLNEMNKAIDLSSDVPPLLALNSCTGPGLKRFQENMRRFALDQSPLVDPLAPAKPEPPPPGKTGTVTQPAAASKPKPKPAAKTPFVKRRPKN